MMRIAHLVNPVDAPSTSDLRAAQPVTFESMRRAKAFASGAVEVDLVTAQFPEDRHVLPDGFRATPDLTRSVLDLEQFARPRRLPLAADLLERLDGHTTADFVIYTNVDIALMPHFYLFVRDRIEHGLDAFMINRRTIGTTVTSPDALSMMYAQLGEKHPGKDCFVLDRRLIPSLDLGRVCVGAKFVAAVVSANLVSRAGRWTVFEDEHLTFHLGDDRAWARPEHDEYARFNAREGCPVLERLMELPAVAGDPDRQDYIRPRLRRMRTALEKVPT